MSLFDVLDFFFEMLPDKVGNTTLPDLSVPDFVKEFFGDDAVSFEKLAFDLTYADILGFAPAECAGKEYTTKFLIDVTISSRFLFLFLKLFRSSRMNVKSIICLSVDILDFLEVCHEVVFVNKVRKTGYW